MRNGTPDTDNRVLRLCRLLNRHSVRYAVPRDLANMRRLLEALSELPYGIARELDAADIVTNPFAIIGDDPRVDILTVAGKLHFDPAWANRLQRKIEGVRVVYLSLEDLRLSKQTGRAKDEADLEALGGE